MNCFVYFDVSSIGCGVYMILNYEYVCYIMWFENECMKSFMWRELYVIEFVFRLFCGELKNFCVKWFIDNCVVVKIVEVGSMRYDL